MQSIDAGAAFSGHLVDARHGLVSLLIELGKLLCSFEVALFKRVALQRQGFYLTVQVLYRRLQRTDGGLRFTFERKRLGLQIVALASQPLQRELHFRQLRLGLLGECVLFAGQRFVGGVETVYLREQFIAAGSQFGHLTFKAFYLIFKSRYTETGRLLQTSQIGGHGVALGGQLHDRVFAFRTLTVEVGEQLCFLTGQRIAFTGQGDDFLVQLVHF